MKQQSKTILNLRPRERLYEQGEANLSTQELLAILLRTGSKKQPVMQLSLEVMNHFEDFYFLKTASIEELMKIKGIGKVKAIELRAAIEFGARVAQASQIKHGQIKSAEDVEKLVGIELRSLQQEHLMVLFLNTKNEIIKKETVFVGGLNSAVAHPREVFRAAIRYASARIFVCHNHPSGNPSPSKADIIFTKKLAASGQIIGIELLDHVIIASSGYYSMKESGVI
ncbi:RadC family protein [Isobaculum melis]|uniref:DNA replication and repair protein RadC n=1 Tax=Isobaculum melis TaxID=142588 RepID=A0A1H9RGG8_9LACT|nr:DNA repair protein RadC [Isobaculum melis]SER71808.1 DNA replication and repair protein RadC [Isobaculum melis]